MPTGTRRHGGGVAMVVAVLLLVLSMPTIGALGKLPGHFGGSAYATSATANAGQLAVRLGRSAFVPCP